jgi:hypothetical protein
MDTSKNLVIGRNQTSPTSQCLFNSSLALLLYTKEKTNRLLRTFADVNVAWKDLSFPQ